MKIKIFSTYYYPNILGGGEISTQILAEGLLKKGIDIEVITLGKQDEIYTVNGVKVKKIGIGKKYRIFEDIINNSLNKNIFFKMKMLILDFINIKLYKKYQKQIGKCDILHITNLHNFSGIPLLYLNKKNFKYIIQSIRAPFFSKGNILKNFFSKVIKKIYNIYSKNVIFHFPTEYICKYTKEQGTEIKKYFIIGNSIDFKNKLENFQEKNINVLYVGKVVQEKGIVTLVETLKKMGLESKSLFIGDGNLKSFVLKKGIKVTGWLSREETYEYMKKSKVLILPSEWEEAFGRVLIEAIANGTLVIGSDRGAIPEVLNFNEKYIFKAGLSEKLQKKILRILNLNEEDYQNEVLNLQKYIEKYNYENHINNFIKNYSKILKSKN